MFLTDLIYFKAQKAVVIRSKTVGFLHKFLVSLVAIYIVGFLVLYRGRHMTTTSPRGSVRLSAQRPVVDHCNVKDPKCQADFTPREDLAYCSQSRRSDSPEDSGEKSQPKMAAYPCEYWDELQMSTSSVQQGHIMLPTRVTVQDQYRTSDCDIGAKPHACKNVYVSHSKGNTTYIADVERFTILIDHAFTVPVADTAILAQVNKGSAIDFPAYFKSCKHGEATVDCELVKVPCVPGLVCDGATGEHHATPTATDETAERLGIFGISAGDVVPVSTLLLLAGVDLDKDSNSDGESLRHTSVVIQIDIQYMNREPFKLKFWEPGPLHYVYQVTHLPFETYKAVETKELNDEQRRVVDMHGILIHASLHGDIAHIDVLNMLVLLASAATLLAVADEAVHLFCSKVWQHKAIYQDVKEDRSLLFDHMSSVNPAEDHPELLEREELCKSLLHDDEDGTTFVRKFAALDAEALRVAAHVTFLSAQKLETEEKDTIRQRFSSYISYSERPQSSEQLQNS